MPYKSKAQAAAMHAKAERGEIPKSVVREFDVATKRKPGGFKALPERVKKAALEGAQLTGAQQVGAGLANIARYLSGDRWFRKLDELKARAVEGDDAARDLLNMLGIASIATGAIGGGALGHWLGGRHDAGGVGTGLGAAVGSMLGTLPMLAARQGQPPAVTLPGFDLDAEAAVGKMAARGLQMIKEGKGLQALDAKGVSPITLHSLLTGDLHSALQQPGLVALVAGRRERIRRLVEELQNPGMHLPPPKAPRAGPADLQPSMPPSHMPISPGLPTPPSNALGMFQPPQDQTQPMVQFASTVQNMVKRAMEKGGAEFVNPFPGLLPDRRLNARELSRALRQALSAEEEATHQYESIADATDDQGAKEVLQDIADEERVHTGEFQQMLDDRLPDEARLMTEGRQEVKDKAKQSAYKYGFFCKIAELGVTPSEFETLIEKSAGTLPWLGVSAAGRAAGRTAEEGGGLLKWMVTAGGKLVLLAGKIPIWVAPAAGFGLGAAYRLLTAPGYADPEELRHIERTATLRQEARKALRTAKRLQKRRLTTSTEEPREREIEIPAMEAA